jgi:hypothetical protein
LPVCKRSGTNIGGRLGIRNKLIERSINASVKALDTGPALIGTYKVAAPIVDCRRVPR